MKTWRKVNQLCVQRYQREIIDSHTRTLVDTHLVLMPKTENVNDKTTALVYCNDMLMAKILGDVEIFQDRNSLELTSQRMRTLCLKTPITRRECYAIRLEADPNWPGLLTLLMRPRKFSSLLTVNSCSNDSKEESLELASFCYKERRHDPSIFYDGVCKRLLLNITEFEIKHRRFSIEVLKNINKFPNLNRVVVVNARSYLDGLQDDEEEIDISDKVKSLELVLDRQWCTELAKMKQLIGPNIKHFCCHVNPVTSKHLWYIEEIMVEMAIHNVHLDQCQVIFSDLQFPNNLILAFTVFLAERSSIMELFVTDNRKNVSKFTEIVPKVDIQFKDEEDDILKVIFDARPDIFEKAELVWMSNLYEFSFNQLSDAIQRFYSVKELHISNSIHNKDVIPIDKVLLFLPSTVESLYIDNCKVDTDSTDILINRGATTIQTLHLTGSSSGNTLQNFNRLLEGLQELKEFKYDIVIPHLLYSKITENAKLETFIGQTTKNVPEKALQILRQHFNHVELNKIDRQIQELTVSNPSRSHL